MNRGAFYGVIASLLWFRLQFPIWLILLILLALYAIMGGYSYLSVVARTIKRDVTGLTRYLQVLLRVRSFQKKNWTVPTVFESYVKAHPNKVAFIFEGREWTFKEIDDFSNRVAHVFEDAGFLPGDTVALLLDNRPEYVAIWIGLAKAGLVTALINSNLRDKPLSHCIQIAECKAVIYGADFCEAFVAVRDQLAPSVKQYAFDFKKDASIPFGSLNLDTLMGEASTSPLSGPQRANYNDKMLYIYTSGTTGLPKAAVIRHSRFTFFVSATYFMSPMMSDDIVYDPLPLYHTAGGMVGAGQVLLFGCTAVLRKKFSASAFWKEAIQHQCTVAQYIGETCRYLLAAEARPDDKNHKVRLMFGNGLRPQIWEEFVNRFSSPTNRVQIAEFYGATEGNANIINFDGTVGAVGFVSMIAPSVYPVALIKVTEDGEPIRGEDGLCIRCKPREPGMFVGMILKNHPIRDFHGYADPNATKKKVAVDVFKRGDAAFLSGDILEMDELGYLFFKDRTGDTFRWRGENVSTSEVEAVISNEAALKDCCVYGVEVPGAEGRAGMAAILDPERALDLNDLHTKMSKVLPSYARPLFIRIVNVIDLTGTYKLRKVDYQKEGIDVSKIKDQVYFFEASSQSYVPFTSALLEQLKSGKIRV
ncbi:long-chain fatty acid transport protein 1-like isoform X1 [Daphnia pulex]|uniref:long-chain fatty acid transport protein 1-like isoform X1 n=1 Tax=Daphnia pulex TaxID=6669 RepID=UPI001EDEFFBB|nr:long-chain fatty acid transport protein 1-like isoform X1 [Daphnia pulex]XP_046441082.1 long-chain fatty acid transport protein 1-like isoform X1 [Daphnia pulex]